MKDFYSSSLFARVHRDGNHPFCGPCGLLIRMMHVHITLKAFKCWRLTFTTQKWHLQQHQDNILRPKTPLTRFLTQITCLICNGKKGGQAQLKRSIVALTTGSPYKALHLWHHHILETRGETRFHSGTLLTRNFCELQKCEKLDVNFRWFRYSIVYIQMESYIYIHTCFCYFFLGVCGAPAQTLKQWKMKVNQGHWVKIVIMIIFLTVTRFWQAPINIEIHTVDQFILDSYIGLPLPVFD